MSRLRQVKKHGKGRQEKRRHRINHLAIVNAMWIKLSCRDFDFARGRE